MKKSCRILPGVFSLIMLCLARAVCFGQTDGHFIGAGDWSEAVACKECLLRGRLLVYDDQSKSVMGHARLYLELQQVFKDFWRGPLEIWHDAGLKSEFRLELRDAQGRLIPAKQFPIRGQMPQPYWVTIPCDGIVRMRTDLYTLGSSPKPDGLEILINNAEWLIPQNATQDFFLSGSFTVDGNHSSPLKYNFWQGILKLPAVKIPAKEAAK